MRRFHLIRIIHVSGTPHVLNGEIGTFLPFLVRNLHKIPRTEVL